MDNLDGTCGPRRVVLDVSEQANGRGYTGGTGKRSRRRHRRKPKGGNAAAQLAAVTAIADDDNSDKQDTIPMELWPAIQEILGYGKKTHALGAMKAASALSNFAERLRELGPPTPALEKIMMDAERESQEIRAMFCRSYEE